MPDPNPIDDHGLALHVGDAEREVVDRKRWVDRALVIVGERRRQHSFTASNAAKHIDRIEECACGDELGQVLTPIEVGVLDLLRRQPRDGFRAWRSGWSVATGPVRPFRQLFQQGPWADVWLR
jgi:hypothetical protein